jgi:hypothetical protein
LHRILCIVLAGALCSCARYPESYPPPEQRHPAEGANPDSESMLLEMSSPGASRHIVKDIDIDLAGPSNLWRWTKQNPTVKILAVTTQNLKLAIDFTLWDIAFRQTGPVELTFVVNGRRLDKIRYSTPGEKHFEKPIPPDWLASDVESTISVSIDKLYIAPQDGAKFGFILSRIGFSR